jgi:hypothetical protein
MVSLLLLSVAAALTAAAPEQRSLSALATEEAVLEELAQADFDPTSTKGSDVEDLVHRGWHDAVRALVARSQRAGSEEAALSVEAQVRHAVYAERKSLDDLVRALDRNYGKAVDVSPAMQWAQNSTHVFLAVKFAQRWNAPGALEVENHTVEFSTCCFNFTAYGEHSFIRRKYHLSFELFRQTTTDASSWFLAAAGRMTVIFAKAKPANWPRLFLQADLQPKNLGVWLDMREKWKSDIEKFTLEEEPAKTPPPVEKKKAGKKQKKQKAVEKETDDDEALDREIELLSECPKSSYAGTSVAEVCEKSFKDVVEKPAVTGRTWLIEAYSSKGTGDLEAMRTLMPVWKRLSDVFSSMVPGGRVGALDCGTEIALCKKLRAQKLPQIRRFRTGSNDEWKGGLDASIEALAAWGGGKDEL